MSWDIIFWLNDQDEKEYVDYVPSKWANESKTQYKSPVGYSQKQVQKMINECLDVEKFKWFRATIKRGHILDLQKAQKLCDMGRENSNLDTATEDDEPLTRKKKITKRFLEYQKNIKSPVNSHVNNYNNDSGTDPSSSDGDTEKDIQYKTFKKYLPRNNQRLVDPPNLQLQQRQ